MISDLKNCKIIFVFNALELGGAERQALLLARHLIKEYLAEVQIWGFLAPGKMTELCDEYEIPWRIAPFKWSWKRTELAKNLITFALTLRKAKPDIIMPYCWMPNIVCGLVWKLTGARLCIWNQRDEGRGLHRGEIARIAVRQTPMFISNSLAGIEVLERTYNMHGRKVWLIPNGVVLNGAKSDRVAWRKRLGVEEDTFLGVMLAHLHSFKDHYTLLKAWRLFIDNLHDSGKAPQLLFAGRLEDTHLALKALAFDLDLGGYVKFLGPIDDIGGLLNAVDLGVHSSYKEGCPNGVLECMAGGLAVVGTDILGIREALGSYNAMHLVPIKDEKSLADKLMMFYKNEEYRIEIGKLNKKRVEESFSVDKMLNATVSVIGKFLRR